MLKKITQIQNEYKILVVLAFFSVSVGLWGNFRQLWLQDYGFAVNDIANLLSLGTFVCAVCAFLLAGKITLKGIKFFIGLCIALKIATTFVLFFLYDIPQAALVVRGLIIADIIFERLVMLSIYPFITAYRKDDNIYSKRRLTEYMFRDIGILLGGIFVGRSFGTFLVDYNFFLLLSVLLLVLALGFLMPISRVITAQEDKNSIWHMLKDIKRNRILTLYLLYYFIGTTAFTTAMGLKMLIFTNILTFSAAEATNYFLAVGLVANVIGIVCLYYLTPKNDYVTISIKFGIRWLMYVIAFLSGNPVVMLAAMTWALLISTAYENKTDAPYINRISSYGQFCFTNVRFVTAALAESVGLFIAGLAYPFGLRYILGLSAFFITLQLVLAYVLIYLRQKEAKSK